MARTIKTTLELGGESAYKKGLQSIDRALKAMSSELKEATAKFSENSASLKNVSVVSNAYKNQVEQQKIKVESLKGAVESSTKSYNDALAKYEQMAKEHGENSVEALKAADSLAKAEKSMDDFKNKLSSAEKYLDSSKKAMEEFTKQNKNVLALAQTTDKLKAKIAEFADKSDNVKKISSAFKDVQDAAKKISDKLTPVKNVLEKVKTGTNSVKGAFELAAKKAAAIKEKLQPAINVCKNVAKEAGKITFKTAETGAKAVTTTVNGAKKAFTAYSTVVAASGLAIGKWAVSTGMEFDSQMSTVAAISGATGDELATLTEKAKEMGQTTSFSATESAQALEYMAMAGWKTDDMVDGLSGVINLAAASGENLASVSDIVTDAMTAFGMSAEESTHFADVLAKASSSANTNVGMMGETFKYVAPLAGTLGYSVEDMSIGIGLMANAGIKGSQAGTSLKTALSNMAKPTDKQAAAMDDLGISLENATGGTKSFMEVMENLRSSIGGVDVELVDSEGNLREYDDIIADLSQTTEGLSKVQQIQAASTIFGKESMSGMLAIINSSEEDFNKLTESIYNADGAAEAMSKTRLDNLQGDITLLKSNAEGVALSVSGRLNPALRFLVKAASGVITAFSERGISGALTQVSTIIPKIISYVSEQFPAMITSFTTGFNSVILSVIQAVIQALPTFVQEILPSLIEGFSSLVNSLVEYLPEFLPLLVEGAVTLFSGLIDSLNRVIDTLMPLLPEIITQISTALIENLPVLLDGALQLFLGLIQSLNQVIEQLMPMLPELITNLCDTLINNIPAIISAGFDLLVGLIQGITECIPTLIQKIPEIINSIVGEFTNNIGKLITAGIDLIIALAEGLPQAIPQVVMAIPQIIIAIINALMEQDWLQVGIDIIKGLANGLIDGVNIIWDKIKEMASSLLSSIKSALGIHSPSKLFRDKVGIFLAQGVGVGFVDEMDKVTKDMQNALPTSFDTMVNADISSFSSTKNHSSSSGKSNGDITVIIDKVDIHNDGDIEETAYKLALKVKQAEMALGV